MFEFGPGGFWKKFCCWAFFCEKMVKLAAGLGPSLWVALGVRRSIFPSLFCRTKTWLFNFLEFWWQELLFKKVARYTPLLGPLFSCPDESASLNFIRLCCIGVSMFELVFETDLNDSCLRTSF